MLVRHSGRNHVYRTKGDGRFAFKIPAGVHEIVFRAAEGFRVLEPSRSVSLTKNTELEPFFVERLPKLNVRVIDAKGKIIPDATVYREVHESDERQFVRARANRPPVRFERDIAEPSRTGKDGVASLTLKESDQQTVQLYASALLGGEKLFGTATTNTPTDRHRKNLFESRMESQRPNRQRRRRSSRRKGCDSVNIFRRHQWRCPVFNKPDRRVGENRRKRRVPFRRDGWRLLQRQPDQ